MSREENVRIFQDTMNFIHDNKILSEAVRSTIQNTKLYKTSQEPTNLATKCFLNNVFVTNHKTFEAVFELRKTYLNSKIAVLNFASATKPGGGVTSGASAQEEALCRCSTLFPCLSTKRLYEGFYGPHRVDGNPLHNDDIIYTPDVIICKTDDGRFNRLSDDKFIKVDVITCAAPNLRHNPNHPFSDYDRVVDDAVISATDLEELHYRRAKQILNVAIENGVKVLVLGAFGCGAFKNSPTVVARAYKRALEQYASKFDEIEFAIYCRDYETQNYDAFKRELE